MHTQKGRTLEVYKEAGAWVRLYKDVSTQMLSQVVPLLSKTEKDKLYSSVNKINAIISNADEGLFRDFQDLEEACIRAKTLSLTEFPVSLLYEPIETEDGWRMKEIFIYMKGRAIASERIRLHCSFYLRAGHKLN